MVHGCECQGQYARWRVNTDLPVDGATPGQSDTLVVELSCLETWKIHQQLLGAKTERQPHLFFGLLCGKIWIRFCCAQKKPQPQQTTQTSNKITQKCVSKFTKTSTSWWFQPIWKIFVKFSLPVAGPFIRRTCGMSSISLTCRASERTIGNQTITEEIFPKVRGENKKCLKPPTSLWFVFVERNQKKSAPPVFGNHQMGHRRIGGGFISPGSPTLHGTPPVRLACFLARSETVVKWKR